MKTIITIFFLTTLVIFGTESYLSINEKNKIITHNNESFYLDVPNIINCNYIKRKPRHLKQICSNSDLILMFKLFSQVNVYAYENATKKEVNHKDYNKNNLQFYIKSYYTNDKLNINQIYFDLKEKTTNLLGGESPYNKLILNKNKEKETYFYVKNQHGYILNNRNGYKIYLGKNYDVLDSLGNNGTWGSNKDGSYSIYIDNRKINFNSNKALKF